MNKPCLAVAFLPMLVVAQDPSPLAFEVASVKPAASPIVGGDSEKPGMSQRHLRYSADGIDVGAFSIRALIVEAYQIESYRGISRVLTLDSRTDKLLDRSYDVIAKAATAASKEALRLMLRTLLADRFKLSVHSESKQQPVYRLVVGKQGARLPQSAVDAEKPHWVKEPGGLVFHDATLAQFCALLSNYMDQPVLDSTGIQGRHNFAYLEGVSSSEEGQSTILSALWQLGLQLVAEKAPLEYLVVNHVEQPSGN